MLFVDQVPIMYLLNRTEYILHIEKLTNDELYFKANRPIAGLAVKEKINLMFDYRNIVISFTVEIKNIDLNPEHFIGNIPEVLYKNLERSYSRVTVPADIQVEFAFVEDRYFLPFPEVAHLESEEGDDPAPNQDTKPVNESMAQMGSWIKGYADGYKLVFFKDAKPQTQEEQLVAETGKVLFIPSTQDQYPQFEKDPKKILITKELFKAHMERIGVNAAQFDKTTAQFIKNKQNNGMLSDAWVPLVFCRYVIGYIHIWIQTEGRPLFDYTMIETLYQFMKSLIRALKKSGYFEACRLKDKFMKVNALDISASGLCFAFPRVPISAFLQQNTKISIKLITAKRTINIGAKIVRQYNEKRLDFFGCRFLDITPEDMRFLFEYIYGKPIMDAEASLLFGQV
ncbi:MAG: PilZ domain-containing protein [Treponema sp.]|nr:PilZ domain-containing protein [Treponema sp.]